MRFASDEALQNQGFETLKELLEVDNEIIVEYSLRSLAEITFNSAGKVAKVVLIKSSNFSLGTSKFRRKARRLSHYHNQEQEERR